MIQLSESAADNRLHNQAGHELEVLLKYLKQSHGLDFTGYKRSVLMRQILKRMLYVEVDSYKDYIDYLEVHQEELTHLFNTILNNFTCFFRDRCVWDYLAHQLVPQIIAAQGANEPIRVWSAGCASGQEAYTLAIVLAEALGVEQFQERVRIYATDIDEEALTQAHLGTYTKREVSGISPTLLEKYFDRTANCYIFRRDLRCSLIFSCHNLIEDAPISDIDLLICRNVLIYFNTETQRKILSRLYNAFQDSGFLVLGQSERVCRKTPTFTPVDLQQRIYTKMPHVNLHVSAACVQDSGCQRTTNRISPKAGHKRPLGERERTIALTDNKKAVKPVQEKRVKRSYPVGNRTQPALEIEPSQFAIAQEELKTLKKERLALIKQLETNKEELQFASNEIEKMNQELQSLTEELHQRNNELNQAKALLAALLELMKTPSLLMHNQL